MSSLTNSNSRSHITDDANSNHGSSRQRRKEDNHQIEIKDKQGKEEDREDMMKEDPGFVEDVVANTGNNKKRKHVEDSDLDSKKSKLSSPGEPSKPMAQCHPLHPHHRRGKKKKGKRLLMRMQHQRRKVGADSNSVPKAPFNSTQFLMNDHSDTNQYLDFKLGVHPKRNEDDDDSQDSMPSAAEKRPRRVITRARDSSFSLNSDEEFFYSSPEDEEDFLSQEFLKDYASIRADRLVTMSKTELIGEYVQMEERIDSLEKRLARSRAGGGDVDGNGAQRVPKDVADRIRAFQRQINALESENVELRRENRDLKRVNQPVNEDEERNSVSSSCSDSCSESCSSGSSSSSDNDSSSSDSSSSSSEDEGDAAENEEIANIEPEVAAPAAAHLPPPENLDETAQDTGYESGQSGEQQRRSSEAAAAVEAVTSTS